MFNAPEVDAGSATVEVGVGVGVGAGVTTGVGAGGSVTGTANSHTSNDPNFPDLNAVRTGTGSGVFAVGASRQVEFGLKLTF